MEFRFALVFALGSVLLGCGDSTPVSPTPTPAPAPMAEQPPPGAIEWAVANGGNGHWYQLSTNLPTVEDRFLNFQAAREKAEQQSFRGVSGHLVTIGSMEENAFVFNNILPSGFSATQAVHLGAFQPEGSREPGGGWQWVTGEPFTFTNWHAGEPNDTVGNPRFARHDFLTFAGGPFFGVTDGTWNDVWDLESAYIIEYDTEP